MVELPTCALWCKQFQPAIKLHSKSALWESRQSLYHKPCNYLHCTYLQHTTTSTSTWLARPWTYSSLVELRHDESKLFTLKIFETLSLVVPSCGPLQGSSCLDSHWSPDPPALIHLTKFQQSLAKQEFKKSFPSKVLGKNHFIILLGSVKAMDMPPDSKLIFGDNVWEYQWECSFPAKSAHLIPVLGDIDLVEFLAEC